MSSLLEIKVVNVKAALRRIRRERQEAKSKHEMKILESSSRLSKTQRELENTARRSKLHWYMGSLREQDPTLSMYVLQKQSSLCMALHRRDVMVRQQMLLKEIQEELVEEMLRERSKTRKKFTRRNNILLHQLSVRASDGKKLREEYAKKWAAQQLVIQHLRELFDEDDDSLSKGSGSGHSNGESVKQFFVEDVFDTVQGKRNYEFKHRMQDHPRLLNTGVTFQRKNHERRKVVADVA